MENPVQAIFKSRKQKNIFLAICGSLIAFVLVLAMWFALGSNPAGISGTYIFEYGDRPIISMTLDIHNNLTYQTYSYDESGKETITTSEEYVEWKRYYLMGYDPEAREYTSPHLIRAQNADSSLFTDFYLVDDHLLYSTSVYEEYGGKQICLAKR